jgi:hypothetical protein
MIWIKHHLGGIILWFGGFSWTIAIDWNHLAARAIETIILAAINGTVVAICGFAGVFFLKKILKKLGIKIESK